MNAVSSSTDPAPTGLSVTSSTDASVSLSLNAVANAYRYKLERGTSSSGPWTDVGSETGDMSGTATVLDCDTTYYFRVSTRGDGSPYSATFGSASSSVSRATSACAPTVGVDLQSPFVGQAVTMTVSTTGSSGTVSSYQWQEWSAGSWTDLGATTTSATRSESSSVAGYRTFRVVVAYTSGTPVESYAITIQWKPMTVGVTSSPAYPQSGPAATSTVTLTAAGDVPSGAEYQWQHTTSSGWTNLGATSISATKEVTSARRGTRKFRVEVRYAGMTVQSEPVYVTWDEWDIVADMIGELSAGVASSSAYLRDQAVLVNCVNATSTGSGGGRSVPTPPPAVTFATFDDLLASYTGDVKARMEDTGSDGCATESNAMFSTNESEARSALATLKVGNSEYAAWLATPHGRQFEGNLGDPDELKFVSYLGATTFEPGEFTAPLYIPSDDGGAVGKSDTTPPAIIPALGTGLDCLPAGVRGADLSLSNKLEVLNCLVFATPHEFWVWSGESTSPREADRLRNEIDDPNGRFAWLNRGDWECTKSPQGPVPSCLKHDVGYGSLQKFAGLDANASLTSPPDGTELDEAWNPRNKALADYKFKADITRWGCQNQLGAPADGLCLSSIDFLFFSNAFMAEHVYFWGTAVVNHKGWPITTSDVVDIHLGPRFTICQEPVVPAVVGVSAVSKSGDIITVSGSFQRGCVPISVANLTFVAEWVVLGYPRPSAVPSGPSSCSVTGDRFTCDYNLHYLAEGSAVTGVTMFVVPIHKEYGGEHYGGVGNAGRRHTVSVGPFEF